MYSKFFLTLCACAVLGTACKKDEKEEVAAHTSKSSGKYLLETSVKTCRRYKQLSRRTNRVWLLCTSRR